MKAKPNFIYVVKQEQPIQKKIVNVDSKQDQGDKSATGQYLTPNVQWKALAEAYDNSFCISGICDKISTSADSGFEKLTENKDDELETFVEKLDIQTIALNMIVFGNSFNEIIISLSGKLLEIDPILTETMYAKKGGGFLQIGGSKTVHFEENEIRHFKRPSIRSKYYGDSIFSKCVQQISLLANIDKFYDKFFDNGLIHPNLLNDEKGDLSDADKESIKVLIQDTMKGLENAFHTTIIPGKLSKVDLVDKIDTGAFLEYRTKLIQAIAISTNIPYSMLVNDSSNRATSSTEYNTFTKEVVTPFQRILLRQLKIGLKSLKAFNDKAIDELMFKSVDVKNQKTEMEIHKGYVESGIETPNEARKELGFEEKENGNDLRVAKTPEQTAAQMDGITKQIKNLYEGE